MSKKPKFGSPPVTPEMAAYIKYLRSLGFLQHDIASRFGINQGRVSEVLTGKRHAQVRPAGKPPSDPQPQLPF